jgi:putative addiction module CopG family antidote
MQWSLEDASQDNLLSRRIRFDWEDAVSYEFPSDVRQMIADRMAAGAYGSEDDVLREALRALEHEENHLHLLQEAIEQWRAGDEGVPLAEAFHSIRAKYGIADCA